MNTHADRHPSRAGLCLLAGLLLAGCQANPYVWDKSVGKSIDRELAKDAKAAQAAAAPPPEIAQALLPPIEIRLPEGGTAPLDARFELSVSNAPARQVFMGLVENTPYSMVVHPEVGGTVTLHLKDVTVAEAMEAIRQVYGYEYRRDGNRFFVLGRGMQTRIFPVNYLNFNRKGKSDTRVTSGELTQAGNTGATGAASGSGQSGGAQGASRLSSIQVETSSQADFWRDLGESLAALIGTGNGRQVVVNPQSGVAIVRALPDELRVVEDFLGLTHATINRQVILEAKIISVELNDSFQTGINWAALQGSSVIGMAGGGTAISQGNALVSNLSPTGTPPGNYTGILDPGNHSPISGTATSAFGGVFSVASKSTDFASFIELLKGQGNVRVLSSPRVSTINNQKAVIKIGGDEFFITGVTSNVTTSGLSTTPSTEVLLTPFFSGIALDVTPQIDQHSNLILHIHPAVSEVTQRDKSFLLDGRQSSLPLAVSSIQESDNVVRAASGQIIVIGGLMKEASSDEDAGIPLLGDLPIIGNLFKHRRVTRVKNELVILLKPTLVDSAQVWGASIEESQERMNKLKR
jgi:MSHA biogenesis protein MshL